MIAAWIFAALLGGAPPKPPAAPSPPPRAAKSKPPRTPERPRAPRKAADAKQREPSAEEAVIMKNAEFLRMLDLLMTLPMLADDDELEPEEVEK